MKSTPSKAATLDTRALQRRERGEPCVSIARDYGVTPQAVSAFHRRWRHLVATRIDGQQRHGDD